MSKNITAFNISELVGNTPLIKLNAIKKSILLKFMQNSNLTILDILRRQTMAAHHVNEAEKQGILKSGSVIVETTSGNTGFSIAMISSIKGYKYDLSTVEQVI